MNGRPVGAFFRNYWSDAALIAGMAFLGFAVTAHVALMPRDPMAPVAVVFAPWIGADAALVAAATAGAQILQAGATSNIVIVLPNDAGYAARAAEQGAWLVADAATVSGCVVTR